ncbi:MAG: hypothetical protein KatS3mg105_1906 [Gemmatales bacterium]|nr:MAG: hypothetical protein KatS3mg105_1906 [Gemmatales bacterium]
MQPHVPRFASRREFLFQAGSGFGALALGALLDRDGLLAANTGPANPLAAKSPHFRAKARSVIFLFMEGGPSHIDTFDPKPELNRLHGQKLPPSFGEVITPMGTGVNALLGSKRKFKKFGKSGIEVSDWLPHIASCIDDIAVVRSCWANGLNHVGSVCQMNTGSILAGRPSLGSWVLYGLGSESENLPGYVVMSDGGDPSGGARNWGTGFMPATYQGTRFRNGPDPILHLNPPAGAGSADDGAQRRKLDLLKSLNEHHRKTRMDDTTLSARIAAYELAYRMQAAAPEAVDLSDEPKWIKEEYGLYRKECSAFAHRCLLARRLVERGVRFVQVYCGGGSKWDAHSGLEANHSRMCANADRPTAALLRDLKRRGLLDETLVIWGGEFGRTPMTEGKDGRDHNPYGFTMWLAGGGVKGGRVVGATDEIGLRAVDRPVHVHDLHATILHLLGLDHLKLTYLHNGRDERATINGGRIVEELFV